MITPAPKPAQAENETCVPQAALEVDGTAPAVGDEFEFTGKGRATRVEGGKVYFALTEVNGQAVEAAGEAGEKEMDADDVMGAAMRADSGDAAS